MHFTSSVMTAVVSAVAVSAGSITFKSQDATTRQVFFVPSLGFANIGPITIPGNAVQPVGVPDGWEGMFYAVQEGQTNKGYGMLGEVTMMGGEKQNPYTSFDISAIDDPTDTDNVKQLFATNGQGPVSGCEDYTQKCDAAYYEPNDIQTQTVPSGDLTCILGGGSQ